MNGIRVYMEGGGKGKESKAAIRIGLRRFLNDIVNQARSTGTRFDIIPCGDRAAAYRTFEDEAKKNREARCLLLVDSEIPVGESASPKDFLVQTEKWKCGQLEDSYHLMAQVMESWVVCDAEAIAVYYGNGFLQSALPATESIEDVGKDRILSQLKRATKGTQKGEYHKIKHGGELLAIIKPAVVERRARHCRRFLNALQNLVDRDCESNDV